MKLTIQEKIILRKSAREWQEGKTGWIPYRGGELPLSSPLVDVVTSLRERGLVELDVMWGQGWYRVNIVGVIDHGIRWNTWNS